jgi:hypothetical protein
VGQLFLWLSGVYSKFGAISFTVHSQIAFKARKIVIFLDGVVRGLELRQRRISHVISNRRNLEMNPANFEVYQKMCVQAVLIARNSDSQKSLTIKTRTVFKRKYSIVGSAGCILISSRYDRPMVSTPNSRFRGPGLSATLKVM